MVTKNIKVSIKSDKEARPVAILVQLASKFESRIYVESGNNKYNAKSIMGMMALGLEADSELLVSADGADEEAAIKEIEAFLTGNN